MVQSPALLRILAVAASQACRSAEGNNPHPLSRKSHSSSFNLGETESKQPLMSLSRETTRKPDVGGGCLSLPTVGAQTWGQMRLGDRWGLGRERCHQAAAPSLKCCQPVEGTEFEEHRWAPDMGLCVVNQPGVLKAKRPPEDAGNTDQPVPNMHRALVFEGWGPGGTRWSTSTTASGKSELVMRMGASGQIPALGELSPGYEMDWACSWEGVALSSFGCGELGWQRQGKWRWMGRSQCIRKWIFPERALGLGKQPWWVTWLWNILCNPDAKIPGLVSGFSRLWAARVASYHSGLPFVHWQIEDLRVRCQILTQ